MNAEHKFSALDWNYASVQNTAGYSELKSIDGDFPTFEIDQNKLIDVGPSISRALILQEPVIYFDQSAEDLAKSYTIDARILVSGLKHMYKFSLHVCVIETYLVCG